ncbi:MAG: ATP-binding protein [Pseudobdellovibrionaceae bacterium]
MIKREIHKQIQVQLKKGKSLLILGPRQVGKTTFVKSLKFDMELNLATRQERLKYEKSPELLTQKVLNFPKKPLVYIDEIQNVPALMGEIQVLIDENKAQFILTGSSARKLKMDTEINLLPGRLVHVRMDPLSFFEYSQSLDDILSYGQLPRIAIENESSQKELELRSYVESYIDEEIRKETRLRQIAPFSRFIELAAIQSGRISNFSEISKELGPTVVTIQSYYQILEDTLFVARINPYIKNASRKKLTKSSRYLFFDLGVRRIAAGEAKKFLPERKGELFEHFIGNEILKWIHSSCQSAQLYFWRDSDGPEVDWIIEYEDKLLPIEVKLTTQPKANDVKHLKVFMKEYKAANQGLVVSRCEAPFTLEKEIRVVSYKNLHEYLEKWKNS